MTTLAEQLYAIIRGNEETTVELRGSGMWCDEHTGTEFVTITVNGEWTDTICPYALDRANLLNP